MKIRFFMFFNLLFWFASCLQETANKMVDLVIVRSIGEPHEADNIVVNI